MGPLLVAASDRDESGVAEVVCRDGHGDGCGDVTDDRGRGEDRGVRALGGCEKGMLRCGWFVGRSGDVIVCFRCSCSRLILSRGRTRNLCCNRWICGSIGMTGRS